MSTSDVDNVTPDFEVEEAPTNPDDTNPDETFIVHRYMEDGVQREKRMPTSDWARYAKENNL